MAMNAVQIYHQLAPLTGRGVSATPRQLNEVANFLNGLLPDVPLDAPTVMALILVFAFIVQFYWTLISITLAENAASSSSSNSATATTTTTTTTTTTATPRIIVKTITTPRTQTVTPAPAPEWRHFLSDFNLPHWVVKRSTDVRDSGVHYRQWKDKATSRDATYAVGVKNRRARHRLSYKEAKQMWETRPFMELQYESTEDKGMWMDDDVPIELSSHRMVSLPHADLSEGSSEVASNMLHAAERWGSRLQEWHVISPEGGQLLTQTLMMMHCAMGGVGYCAKLDHHFRRQHDLNLAAAMMNYPYEDTDVIEGEEYYAYGDYEAHDQWHPEEPDRALSPTDEDPEHAPNANAVPAALADGGGVKAQRRHSKQKDGEEEKEKNQQDDTKRVSKPSGVGKSSWNLYFFMSVMAVLVFLMDASYRILRVVSSSTGRALQDPHQDVLATLMTAIRRWEMVNAQSQM